MKHLAKIQSEFFKTARKWKDLSYGEQKAYLKKHPKSKRKLDYKIKSDNDDSKYFAIEINKGYLDAATYYLKAPSLDRAKRITKRDLGYSAVIGKIKQIGKEEYQERVDTITKKMKK